MDGTYLRFAGLSQASGYQSNWVELLIQEWQHCKYTKFWTIWIQSTDDAHAHKNFEEYDLHLVDSIIFNGSRIMNSRPAGKDNHQC